MIRTIIAAIALLAGENVGAQAPDASDAFVVVCPITGMVDDGMAVVVERAVKESAGAAALILEVDTPGGLVDSAIEITKSIMSAPCPTIAYVKGMGAISAGALISYACKDIVMAPGTNIGASAPIMMGVEQASGDVDEKTKSYLRSRYRALAEVNGHDPLLAEAMVDAKIEVWGTRGEDGRYVFVRGSGKEIPEAPAAAPETPADPLQKALTETLKGIGKENERAREILRQALAASEPEPPAETPPAEAPTEPEPQPETSGMELICRSGELLTLTTSEALKYGIIPTAAETLDAALEHFDYAELRRVPIVPTWSEALFRWLTSPLISGLLLMLGIGGIYVELRTPGIGLPGIIGACCLALFFGSHLVIGLANWIDILLVLVGLALVLAELFLIPGFGVTGTAGIFCILAGVYLSLTRVPIPQYSWEFQRLQNAGQTITTATVLFLLFVAVTWKFFPKTPFYRWLVLAHTQDPSLGYAVQGAEQAEAAIGLRGVAETVLRPAGRGRFGGKTYDVVTQGEYIEPGKPIEIVQVAGNRYVVTAHPEEPQA
jgi:membrane-bound serine protease (ClpP class)